MVEQTADNESMLSTPQGEEPQGWREYIVASIEQMIILLGVYIFSIGPMYWIWLESKQVDGTYAFAVIYEPLWILAGIIPPLGEWLNWYVRLWIF